jgi:phage-related protein
MVQPKKFPAIFYRSKAGNELVRAWLNGPELGDQDRKVIGVDVAKAEYGWPIGMPTCESLGDGLHEIRSHLANNRITRIIFSVEDGYMVLLHGFVKKATDGIKTPKREIDVAIERRKDLRRRSLEAKRAKK